MLSNSVDINHRQELKERLSSLNEATAPLWGIMKPQHMVEHMIDQVAYSNGKKVTTCDLPAAVAKEAKHKWIYTDAQIPHNLVLKPHVEAFEYSSMQAAIHELMQELEAFDGYFSKPGVTAVHGGYGPMTHLEWIIWHNKHFTHHFKQFKLISAQLTNQIKP